MPVLPGGRNRRQIRSAVFRIRSSLFYHSFLSLNRRKKNENSIFFSFLFFSAEIGFRLCANSLPQWRKYVYNKL